jgi:hypothetical protein
MALSRYVLTSTVTVAAGTASADTLNDNGSATTPATGWSALWPTTFLAGQAILLDPSGKLYGAIGAGNLRAWADGIDNVGHQGTAN